MEMQKEVQLFSDYNWFTIEEGRKKTIAETILKIDENQLLNMSINDLCDCLETQHHIEIPILKKDESKIEPKEIDVTGRPGEIHFGTNINSKKGLEISIFVPFEGTAYAFKIRPSSFRSDPPVAELNEDYNMLIFRFKGQYLSEESIKQDLDRKLAEIIIYLNNLEKNVTPWNNNLKGFINNLINARRQKLLNDRNLVASLGFPLVERKDNSYMTYIAPEVKRKIIPSFPYASNTPYDKSEPILGENEYEHILSVLENMSKVMENAPSSFITMEEEDLRWHFITQLRGHYENVTGETFNYEGKTDILVQSEGKNIFIGECKIWRGEQVLLETIDQILGYASWRDTKVAILFFNRNKDLSKVLSKIPETVEAHNNFKKFLKQVSQTHFRYLFSHRDDINREMTLSILVFDVPKKMTETNPV